MVKGMSGKWDTAKMLVRVQGMYIVVNVKGKASGRKGHWMMRVIVAGHGK